MAVVQINRDPSRRTLNQFGFIWLAFLCVFGLVAWFRASHHTAAIILWAAAVAVPVVGWLVPAFMRVVYLGLSYAAFPIGFVISHIVLAVVYYLIITPVGLAMRLFGYDPMERAIEPDRESYWSVRDPHPDPKQYFKQY
jgi:hypothetical protein